MEKFQEFVWAAFDLAQRSLNTYSSPYAKKTFTQPQLATLNLIRIKCDWTYRETVEFIGLMTPIRDHLELDVMPHYTTIQKAFDRMSMSIARLLLKESLDAIELSGFSGVDASGFERSVASTYYAKTAKVDFKTIKTTVLADVKKQVVLDAHLTTTRTHDTHIGPDLLKKHPELTALTADKGYDDRSFREQLREASIRPLIRHREHKSVDKAANTRMVDGDYHQRSKVETVFSVLKRKYGNQLRARVWYRQFRELILRMVVFNLERIVKECSFLDMFLWSVNRR